MVLKPPRRDVTNTQWQQFTSQWNSFRSDFGAFKTSVTAQLNRIESKIDAQAQPPSTGESTP